MATPLNQDHRCQTSGTKISALNTKVDVQSTLDIAKKSEDRRAALPVFDFNDLQEEEAKGDPSAALFSHCDGKTSWRDSKYDVMDMFDLKQHVDSANVSFNSMDPTPDQLTRFEDLEEQLIQFEFSTSVHQQKIDAEIKALKALLAEIDKEREVHEDGN